MTKNYNCLPEQVIRNPAGQIVESMPSLKIVQKRLHIGGLILVFLTLFSGCVVVPVPSHSEIEDKLLAIQPLNQGDVLVVCGENAPPPNDHVLFSYVTAGCYSSFQKNTVDELIKAILKANPHPGKFAVKHLTELERETNLDPAQTDGDSILCRLNLSKAKVLRERLRYVVHIKEDFETTAHLPLYVSPFGAAACNNKTVLKADLWDLLTEKSIGSLTVSSTGEYILLAYIFHIGFFPDTQKDATQRLAQDIVEKLALGKPDEEIHP